MKKKAFIIGLFVILILAVATRWIFFDNESVWLDEVYSLKYSENIGDVFTDVIENNDPHPPGYYLLLSFWRVGGDFFEVGTATFAKIFSVFWGVLGILVMYFWAYPRWGIKGLVGFGNKMAYFLGIVLAINFFAIFYSIEIRMYSLLFFLMSLSLYLLFAMLENFSWKKLIAFVFVVTASLYVHYFAFFWAVFLFLFWILYTKRFWKWIVAGAGVVILYLPWTSVLVKQVLLKVSGGSENLTSWLTMPSPSYAIFKTVFEEFFYFQGFLGKNKENVFALLVFVFAALIIYLFVKNLLFKKDNFKNFLKNNNKWILFFGLGFLMNLILPYVFSVTISPIMHPRYLVGAFLLAMIFLALLVSKLRVGYFAAIIFTVIFSGTVLFQANAKYFHPDWNGFFMKYENELPQIIYVTPDYYRLPLEYHLARLNIADKEVFTFDANNLTDADFTKLFSGKTFAFVERLSEPEFVELMKKKCTTLNEDHFERIGYYVFTCQ